VSDELNFLVYVPLKMIVYYLAKSEIVASNGSVRWTLVRFKKDERSPWKNQQRQARFYWKRRWSFGQAGS